MALMNPVTGGVGSNHAGGSPHINREDMEKMLNMQDRTSAQAFWRFQFQLPQVGGLENFCVKRNGETEDQR